MDLRFIQNNLQEGLSFVEASTLFDQCVIKNNSSNTHLVFHLFLFLHLHVPAFLHTHTHTLGKVVQHFLQRQVGELLFFNLYFIFINAFYKKCRATLRILQNLPYFSQKILTPPHISNISKKMSFFCFLVGSVGLLTIFEEIFYMQTSYVTFCQHRSCQEM